MHKEIKKNIIEILDTVFEAHNVLKKSFDDQNYQEVNNLLADCQETVINVGGYIEKSEGEDCDSILLLNEYCKTLYDVSGDISNLSDGVYLKDILDKSLLNAKNSIEDIKVKYEIVFMPYKASMWDSLESVWEAAKNDPECDVYVVPIPYYDRNPDHSFGDFHYEGNEFPDYVPITSYVAYDLSKRRPDIIYIHNPYDDCNFVTSVAPRFYSRELKKHTGNLVYIPYGIFKEVNPENDADVESTFGFTLASAVINADKVFLQSSNMKSLHIKAITKYYGKKMSDEFLNSKFYDVGSPKCDKIFNINKDSIDIPEKWVDIINKTNNRKLFFYNTGITDLLNKDLLWIEEIRESLSVFEENKESVILLWRPHPLIESTLQSMRPWLLESYLKLKHDFLRESWGIFDDTSDLNRAIALCDCFYGNWSSVHKLFLMLNKRALLSEETDRVSEDLQRFIDDVCINNKNTTEVQEISNCGKEIHRIMMGRVD